MRKLRNNRGETLIETLAALLIATLVLMFLSIAIVTAAKINSKLADIDTPLSYEGKKQDGEVTVTIYDESNSKIGDVKVQQYTTVNEDSEETYKYYKEVSGNG